MNPMSKLKCPFCGTELQETFGAYMCRHTGCKICCCLLPTCVIESLIQAKQDLEIARKALEDIKNYNKAMRSVLGDQIPEESTDTEEYCWLTCCRIQDCLNALKQITHDNSEKANSVEHKE